MACRCKGEGLLWKLSASRLFAIAILLAFGVVVGLVQKVNAAVISANKGGVHAPLKGVAIFNYAPSVDHFSRRDGQRGDGWATVAIIELPFLLRPKINSERSGLLKVEVSRCIQKNGFRRNDIAHLRSEIAGQIVSWCLASVFDAHEQATAAFSLAIFNSAFREGYVSAQLPFRGFLGVNNQPIGAVGKSGSLISGISSGEKSRGQYPKSPFFNPIWRLGCFMAVGVLRIGCHSNIPAFVFSCKAIMAIGLLMAMAAGPLFAWSTTTSVPILNISGLVRSSCVACQCSALHEGIHEPQNPRCFCQLMPMILPSLACTRSA